LNNEASDVAPEESRYKKWVKNKVKEMSSEYKYNFFLRLGIELFLEVFILSLLNIYNYKVENVYQCLSLAVA